MPWEASNVHGLLERESSMSEGGGHAKERMGRIAARASQQQAHLGPERSR